MNIRILIKYIEIWENYTKKNKQDTIDTSLKYKLKTNEINNLIKESARNK